jgi:hypothetical protein
VAQTAFFWGEISPKWGKLEKQQYFVVIFRFSGETKSQNFEGKNLKKFRHISIVLLVWYQFLH